MELFQGNSLEIICFYFITEQQDKINNIDTSQFVGEAEKIAILGFSKEHANISDLEEVAKKLNNPTYKKHLNVYHFLGLSLQDALHETNFFDKYVQEIFDNQSIRYKYLIAKIFNDFEEQLKKHLLSQIETKDSFVLILKYLYLETTINRNSIINDFKKELQNLDAIDLLALYDLRNIQSIGYNKLQNQLFEDILWCATEIQSKHKILNNNEDQYNSIFQSLLTAKGYRAQDQTQRGLSSNKSQYGELDVAIFSKDDIPLSILEAFIIETIDKNYITKHLKKLSENYDPTGLKANYAVIYAKNQAFSDFWEKYKNFVPNIVFEYEALTTQVEDISNRFPQFAGIKVGLTKYQNRGTIVEVFHIFMDMNLT
ncbi:MAG: hypothetical protein HUU45_13250 [Leptospiraceae bacterium]|nr:hypothetical protein [Leptospiraceae bacterium]